MVLSNSEALVWVVKCRTGWNRNHHCSQPWRPSSRGGGGGAARGETPMYMVHTKLLLATALPPTAWCMLICCPSHAPYCLPSVDGLGGAMHCCHSVSLLPQAKCRGTHDWWTTKQRHHPSVPGSRLIPRQYFWYNSKAPSWQALKHIHMVSMVLCHPTGLIATLFWQGFYFFILVWKSTGKWSPFLGQAAPSCISLGHEAVTDAGDLSRKKVATPKQRTQTRT